MALPARGLRPPQRRAQVADPDQRSPSSGGFGLTETTGLLAGPGSRSPPTQKGEGPRNSRGAGHSEAPGSPKMRPTPQSLGPEAGSGPAQRVRPPQALLRSSNRRPVPERPRPRRPPQSPPTPRPLWRRGRGRAVAVATRGVHAPEWALSGVMAGVPPGSSRSSSERPLTVKVVGLFKSSSFQIAKSAAESLKNSHPSKFEDPVFVPLQEFAWEQYLQEKKRELRGEVWEYPSTVMCFLDGQFLGDASSLQRWAHKLWDVVDVKPPALYEALTLDYSMKFLRDTKHNFVFLDVSIESSAVGRLVFELYCDACPKTCRNFQTLCTGRAGSSPRGFRLHYKGSIFHRVVPNGWVQGGDIVAGKGNDGESIYGPTFEDENFSVPHNKKGVLGMVNKGCHTNGSQFYVTLQAAPYLDRKYVAFGQLVEGTKVLQQLELVPTENERPVHRCVIMDSGDLFA
ncbi:putative inactive peptidyl-prolyl cis-trans isomerase-like 6 [Ctenodactylus gundi]